MEPGLSGHVHDDTDETFVILSGEVVVWQPGVATQASPGATVFIPRGTAHSFRVVGAGPCRYLVILTPAASKAFSPTWPPVSSGFLLTWVRSAQLPPDTTCALPARL